MTVGLLLSSKEFVDADRSLCQDCNEIPEGKNTKALSFGVFSGKYGYAFIENWKRVYIPPDAYAITLNAVIHKKTFYINTNTRDYCIIS